MIRSMLGVNTVYKDGFATLRFHRTSVRGGMERRRFVRTRPIRLSPQTWNHLLITSGRMHTTVRVNCRPVELTQSSRIAMAPSTWMVRLGVGDKDTGSPRPQLTGFVGQRDKDNHYWVVSANEKLLRGCSWSFYQIRMSSERNKDNQIAHTTWSFLLYNASWPMLETEFQPWPK